MACDILSAGRLRECKTGIGGNQNAYLFQFVSEAFTVVDGIATAINPLVTQVFKYELEGDLNTLVENKPSDRNTGTSINTQTLTLSLKKLDATTTAQMNILTHNYVMAVVENRAGDFKVVGMQEGIDFTVETNTGGAMGDFTGYTLTGTALTPLFAPTLDEATKNAFLSLVA